MATATRSRRRTRRRSALPVIIQSVVLIVLLAALGKVVMLNKNVIPAMDEASLASPPASSSSGQPGLLQQPEASPEPTPEPTPEPLIEFNPHCVEDTEPSNFIKTVGVNVDGETLEEDKVYEAAEPIDFGYGKDYTDVNGIVTFRGDNFRSGAAYGLANMSDFKFSDPWKVQTATLGEWSGSGWVGQPLIVKWPKETKAIMNMYDWAKEDDELVEVIYATMDGNIYFLDLATGKATRDKLNMGYTFKGAGALDPRGYPILYIGSGVDSTKGVSRAFVISLIDYEVLYEFGNRDPFTLRGELSYFDSSPLVDAETDQLIYPGENGILYIIKLNTDYDEKAGTLSIDPERVVKWHYYGKRTSLASYWVGMEDSAVIFRGHIIMADNGGNLMCLDLNTLTLDWVQDTLDDTNCSPVLSIEDGHPYVYISTSFHEGWRSWTTAKVPIWKIDAETGEIVWQTDFTCYTEKGVSGGVQSTAALGKNDLEGYVYFTVAKTDNRNNGKLVCLDRETGEVVWEYKAYYTWSSPVLVYNDDGSGYVIYCTYGNNMNMLDGKTGELLDSFNLQGGVEASPAVYNDRIVVGTRKCLIWGIRLS